MDVSILLIFLVSPIFPAMSITILLKKLSLNVRVHPALSLTALRNSENTIEPSLKNHGATTEHIES